MSQHLIIAYPHETGGWVAVLPDFIGVTGRGDETGLAMWRAAMAAQQNCAIIERLRGQHPNPIDIKTARQNDFWATA